jgi:hypothetical protein
MSQSSLGLQGQMARSCFLDAALDLIAPVRQSATIATFVGFYYVDGVRYSRLEFHNRTGYGLRNRCADFKASTIQDSPNNAEPAAKGLAVMKSLH